MVHSRGGNSSALEALNTTFHKQTRHRVNPNSTQFTLRHTLIQQYPGHRKMTKKNRPMGYNNSDFSIHLMPRYQILINVGCKCLSLIASNLPGAESMRDRALMIIIKTCRFKTAYKLFVLYLFLIRGLAATATSTRCRHLSASERSICTNKSSLNIQRTADIMTWKRDAIETQHYRISFRWTIMTVISRQLVRVLHRVSAGMALFPTTNR